MSTLFDNAQVGNIRYGVALSTLSTMRVGGTADVVAQPASPEQLITLLRLLKTTGTKYIVVGNCSNILFSDNGFRGVVIRLTTPLQPITITGTTLEACGAQSTRMVSLAAIRHGLSGLQHFHLIPARVGGAVVMNSGCYGYVTSSVLTDIVALNSNGDAITLSNQQLCFGHRCSSLINSGLIVLKARFDLQPTTADLLGQASQLMHSKQTSQPLSLPSLGSVFKHTGTHSAAKLIDQAGLKGLRVGGAEVSQKHAGFIVNIGNATATDVLQLIDKIKNIILRRFSIELKEEIRIIGD